MRNEVKIYGKTFEKYLPEEEILKGVSNVAKPLNIDYRFKKPLIVAVLNGAFMFASDLMKQLDFECDISFVKYKSYEGTSSTGKVDQLIGFDSLVKERHVILVEDIIDTGNTLVKLLEEIKHHLPASVKVATLLFKPEAYNKQKKIDYIGLEIPEKFIVGYGLDFNGLGRNLKDIYALKE